MRLLVTGFEPFGGRSINPSQQAALALADRDLGVELHTAILPVDWQRAPGALLSAIDEAQPDAVICLGEAAGRARLSIERVAINLLDFRIADNAGQQIVDQPVIDGGPDAYFATLPVRAMFDAAHTAGVPTELSLSAGAFLCNQITYALLHHCAVERRSIRAGFIHLPLLPEQAIAERAALPSMALETVVRGLEAAIGAL